MSMTHWWPGRAHPRIGTPGMGTRIKSAWGVCVEFSTKIIIIIIQIKKRKIYKLSYSMITKTIT
jgi:hypothetical protein